MSASFTSCPLFLQQETPREGLDVYKGTNELRQSSPSVFRERIFIFGANQLSLMTTRLSEEALFSKYEMSRRGGGFAREVDDTTIHHTV